LKKKNPFKESSFYLTTHDASNSWTGWVRFAVKSLLVKRWGVRLGQIGGGTCFEGLVKVS